MTFTPVLHVRVRHRFASGFSLDLEFSAPDGITILFGPSGAGKSTLLDCVAGLRTPETGRVALGERVLFDSEAGVSVPVPARSIAYVLQGLALFPHMSVQANVEYGIRRLPADERHRRATAMLENFKIVHLRDQRPAQVSGGERQRVALARALVTQPSVLLLDEPLAALDAATKSRLLADLRAWNDAHRIPILYVTHSRDEVFALGEHVVAMDRGSVIARGSPQELLHAPRHELLAQLAGFENIFDATVVARHEDTGIMTCRLEPAGTSLEVPLGTESAQDRVRIGVRAGDILLATRRPEGISARNVLPGRIITLERRDVTTVAEVDCGMPFQVHLTPGAEKSLALATGAEVWLIIKTYSCHLLRPA